MCILHQGGYSTTATYYSMHVLGSTVLPSIYKEELAGALEDVKRWNYKLSHRLGSPGKIQLRDNVFPICRRSRLRIWSRDTGSVSRSRVSPVILHDPGWVMTRVRIPRLERLAPPGRWSSLVIIKQLQLEYGRPGGALGAWALAVDRKRFATDFRALYLLCK